MMEKTLKGSFWLMQRMRQRSKRQKNKMCIVSGGQVKTFNDLSEDSDDSKEAYLANKKKKKTYSKHPEMDTSDNESGNKEQLEDQSNNGTKNAKCKCCMLVESDEDSNMSETDNNSNSSNSNDDALSSSSDEEESDKEE
jgi:hypothetical protein